MAGKGLSDTTVCQVGIIVKNIEESAKRYAALLGVEVPPIGLTDPAEKSHIKYRGDDTEAQAKLAFFKTGTCQIELIEPVGGPSTWKEFLDKHGEGVHHIAFHVPKLEEDLAFLKTIGMEVAQKGDYTGGCYHYVEGAATPGVTLELLASR